MTVRILDAAQPADRCEWIRLWDRWPAREVAGHPAYAELFARPSDRVICAAVELESGGVLYPFLLRSLAAESWTDAPVSDITTPYGYGGPFAWEDGRDASSSFWSEFDEWATSAQVVSSFARLSLFPDQQLPFRGLVINRMPNVVRSLELSEEALWSDYAHKVRKNVKRARREGLTVEVDPEGSRLDDFLAIYHGTMERRGARESYLFPRSFFEKIRRDLHGQHLFFHAVDENGQVLSTELVLSSVENLYSFLGGTRQDKFAIRPNDLLKHEIGRWGQAAGKRRFVLGGGYGGEDGIYRYKLSFAPNGAVPFRIGTRIHDEAASRGLEEQRRRWEQAEGRDWSPNPEFFPPYRS